jgi:tripartite-type tricarboxylate transporter receptor subunit TctC
MRKLVLVAMIALASGVAAGAAHAQVDWPKREVRIYVGFSAGGSTDIVARLIAQDLSKAWGQPVLVENRAGATGNIAAELVAKAKPDGYTLLMGSVGPLAINASLFKAMPFDNLKDFTPITLVTHVPNMLVVNPRAFPVATFPDLIAAAKANPGKYFYASTGSGTSSHLSAELLKMQTGIDIVHVPYKGAVAVTDLLSGESVHLMFATVPSVINHVRAGKLRALAVTSTARSGTAPELPTVAESGFPGFEASSWFALVGPAGLSRDIVLKISTEVARALKQPELREKLVQQGADPVGSTPEELGEYMRSETAKWAKVVQAVGAKVD